MRWQLSWSSYLQKSLTDANLQQYFADHRRGLRRDEDARRADLLTCPDDARPVRDREVRQQAQTIRDDILAGNDLLRRRPASTRITQRP